MKYLFMLLAVLAGVYLVSPVPGFPPPPPKSLISTEPADTESIYRKAYYTDLSRNEVINYYKSLFTRPFLRLNHPPEETATAIRDQTQSSWLEELVHPGKDSLFINGFYPTKPTQQININGVHYQAKITLHYFPSNDITRFTALALAVLCIYFLAKEYAHL